MSENTKPPIVQATPFQRFTIRLIDGRFVRVPKSDLPSTQGVDQSATSNQPEMRGLFQLVNGHFVQMPPPEPKPAAPPPVRHRDPTFELPADHRLPGAD